MADTRADPPRHPVIPEEPPRAAAPAWSTMATGMVAGIAVAAVSGQWYFALFSLVTGVVTATSWLVRVVRQRRQRRAWRVHVTEVQRDFADVCWRHARDLACIRRRAHPALVEIRDAVLTGGAWFWHRRVLDQVAIGSGRRAINVVDDAPVAIFDDIPILIDIQPGTVIGVHGRSAQSAIAALIVRLAAQVGPSDWRLTVVGQSPWHEFELLPQFVECGARTPSPRLSPSRGSLPLIETARPEHPVVAVVTDPSVLVRHSPLQRAVESRAVIVIVMARSRAGLPSACRVLVDADDGETFCISSMASVEMCAAISAWSDPDLLSAVLPASVTFQQIASMTGVQTEDIKRVWTARRGCGPRVELGLSVALGVESGVVSLDFDRDGPHAAVIGTTGSGKSELLRLIAVSMAMNNSPADVSLVLIDYKGGSAFDACTGLPHVVGVVTDLDVGMADRVLHGLHAELLRRESILRAARVSDIREFHRRQLDRRREAGPDDPDDGAVVLPRLVVMIDELAALRADVPDFVPALAAIAQRGRSLGLHLVAASQRSTALGADVLANASIRLALRVQSAADSHDIIGSDRAALIDRDRPGRLVMAIAGGESLDVQAAHVSAELSQIADALSRFCIEEGVSRPHRPWCDPLPDVITRPATCAAGIAGIADDVRRQSQSPWSFTWDRHLLVIGGAGRTNAIRAVIGALGEEHGGTDVIIISCRAGDVEKCATYGYVISMTDHEKVSRALQLVEARAFGHRECEAQVQRVILAVDDLDVWRTHAAGDRIGSALWERFERIVTSASIDRVVCVVTSAREQGVPGTIQTRMGQVLRGSGHPGVFRAEGQSTADGVEIQMFWESYDDRIPRSQSAELEATLRSLPLTLVRSETSQACAVMAETWMDISWTELARADDARTTSPLRFLVVGPLGSGVSSALASIAHTWRIAHPRGRVMDLAQWESQYAQNDVDDVLVVMDDVHRTVRDSQSRSAALVQWLSEQERAAQVSFAVGVTPTFVRTQHDHWIQHLRRCRTGVLLGRSAEEDCDLLGVHAPPLHVYRSAPGRGLWVDNGTPLGIVQFYAQHAQ